MYGLVDGVYQCNLERTEELNTRISERNIPSESLKPNLNCRPQQTKFTILGKEDPSQNTDCPRGETYPHYSPKRIFNPGNAPGPWYGYASSINEESLLRNQYFALQGCDQGKYMPSTKSDLYQATIVSKPTHQPHPHLFRTEDFSPFQPNTCGIAKQLFHNHTHQQIKDL